MVKEVLVVRVIDGDTFEDINGYRYRLADIDTPEAGSKGAAEASQVLRDWIEGHYVIVEVVSKDTYGRFVVNVMLNGDSINDVMQYYTK